MAAGLMGSTPFGYHKTPLVQLHKGRFGIKYKK